MTWNEAMERAQLLLGRNIGWSVVAFLESALVRTLGPIAANERCVLCVHCTLALQHTFTAQCHTRG